MELVDAKSIVRKSKGSGQSYLDAEYIMNIYRGCSHGCIYCFARGAYYNIQDFDRVRAKRNALQIIRDELRRKVKTGIITTGGMSDPYNPMEKEQLLTRHSLELINAYEFGSNIITKSDLVLRDMDIFSEIMTHSPVNISFTVTCAQDELCAKIEPNVSLSSERLQAISKLTDKGIVAGVLMDPLLPHISGTKENVTEMVKKAKAYGAQYIYASMGLTLEGIQQEYFLKEIEKLFPGMAKKYAAAYRRSYYCPCPNSKALWSAFIEECEKQNIIYEMPAINSCIRNGYHISQIQMRLD